MKKLTLPARASPARGGRFIPLPGWRGVNPSDFKAALRERAKRHPLYRLPVQVRPPVEGRTELGVPIPIDTLGRWLWGVPGYAGNAVFDAFSDPPGVWLPEEAPPEADRLIRELDQ